MSGPAANKIIYILELRMKQKGIQSFFAKAARYEVLADKDRTMDEVGSKITHYPHNRITAILPTST